MGKYQKEYRQKYYLENKIISFPLKNHFYNELLRRSDFYDLSVNSYAKHIVTSSLNNDTIENISIQEQEYISKYIQVSRGIANNINQIAHNTNIGELVDVDVLIKSLRHYEEEFKKFISKSSK